MWIPHEGSQEEFLRRQEFEVLYGGAAGPGKTDCLVAGATEHVHVPGYRAILFRRTFPQLQEIQDRCYALYPSIGGVYRATERRWYFPGGDASSDAKPFIQTGHMQHEDDKHNYQGKQFHYAGFDELTQFTESQYLYIAGSRVRSVVPGILPAVRSSTNPGGVGHLWVKERFVDIGAPGTVHTDTKTGLTRIFIPGTVYDNPTLMENDPGYIQRLEMLNEIEKKRLLYGDWEVFAGQVFTQLSQRIHGCEPFDIPPEWQRFMVMDWGYAKPFSVGWYAVDYDEILYRYREWYGCKEGSVDEGLRMVAGEVAQGILDREEPNEKIRIRLADPSMWNRQPENRRKELVGQDLRSDFMGQGVVLMKADPDRLQGIGQVHKRFALDLDVDEETGEVLNESPRVQIFNTCEHFWRTVPAIQADRRHAEDVDTKQEDHCLSGDTLVDTINGPRQIAKLVGGDGLVRTVDGLWTRYWDCRLTRENAEMVRVAFEDGRSVECTPDHNFLNIDGEWIEAKDFIDELSYTVPSVGDSLCKSPLYPRPSKNSMAFDITYAARIFRERGGDCIVRYGKALMDRFLTAITSTMSTMTPQTMPLRTLLLCGAGLICPTTIRGSLNQTGGTVSRPLGNGTEAKRGDNGTESNSSGIAVQHSRGKSKRSAKYAESNTSPVTPQEIAQSIAEGRVVPVRCVSVEPLKARRDVYCLVADVSHAFSVNGGIVVSNCYDEFRYACMFKPIRPKRPHRGPPAGSFQAQRAKLIRARKYARSHGVSLDVAYTKVR